MASVPPPPLCPPPHGRDEIQVTVDDDGDDSDSSAEGASGRSAGSTRATPPGAQRGRGRGTGGTAPKSKKKTKRDSSSVTTHTHARVRAHVCLRECACDVCASARAHAVRVRACASTRWCARMRVRRCVRVRVPCACACACASTLVCARVQRLVRVRRCARVHVCVGWCLTSGMLVCATAQKQKVYPVDSEEGTRVRRDACRKLIQENNCKSEGADADMKDRYYGWRALPMQAAQIGGVVPREMKLGVVCEPFVPSNPTFGKVDNPDQRKWFCCCHDECKQVYVFNGTSRGRIPAYYPVYRSCRH